MIVLKKVARNSRHCPRNKRCPSTCGMSKWAKTWHRPLVSLQIPQTLVLFTSLQWLNLHVHCCAKYICLFERLFHWRTNKPPFETLRKYFDPQPLLRDLTVNFTSVHAHAVFSSFLECSLICTKLRRTIHNRMMDITPLLLIVPANTLLGVRQNSSIHFIVWWFPEVHNLLDVTGKFTGKKASHKVLLPPGMFH